MRRIHTFIPALLTLSLAIGATGCVVRGTSGVHVRAGAYYTPPRLVYVSPGVQVVYDYDQPVFYSDGYYWRHDGRVWYRSSYHSHGWLAADAYSVPHAIVRIDRPHYYVHYRGEVRSHYRPAPYRTHATVRVNPTPVRVHVNPTPVRVHVRSAPPRPVVRDHRTHGTVRVRAGGTIRVR